MLLGDKMPAWAEPQFSYQRSGVWAGPYWAWLWLEAEWGGALEKPGKGEAPPSFPFSELFEVLLGYLLPPVPGGCDPVALCRAPQFLLSRSCQAKPGQAEKETPLALPTGWLETELPVS